MIDKTSQKIMDSALNLFARYGYKGASAKAIAYEAGFNELTLFRKFKTKRNLLNEVIAQNTKKFKREYFELMVDEDFDDTRKFLKSTIRKIAKITDDNIEYIRLTVFEKLGEHEPLEDIMPHLVSFMGKNIKNEKIDILSFTLTITGAFIMLSNNRYLGRRTIDQEMFVDLLTNNFLQCI
ncbi:MAG TPA: TetR/AcrR family transcriptional regulator [Methanobacterium sp.]